MLQRKFFSAILAVLASGSCQALVELPWGAACVDPGYDYCGVLEFCEGRGGSFGYRLPGERECTLQTAPLIRMKSGKNYQLTLSNVASVPTNLHTHGLHVVGEGNSDNVERVVRAGQCAE